MQDIVQTNSNYALKSGLRRTNAFQHKYKLTFTVKTQNKCILADYI